MLEQLWGDLERVRADRDTWAEVAFARGEDEKGHVFDRHELARARVLWALQYDRRSEDLPLLRYLLEQEATCRQEAPDHGMTEELEMAGYFVAGHRQVEDVWLLWRAKQANFDTWCGFDVSYLYAGGVEATIDAVRASTHPDRDTLLERLLDDDGAPHVSDVEVEEYLEGAGEQFPTDPELDGHLRWVERARRLGDLDSARRLLNEWAGERPQDGSTLRTMQYELADLGDFGAAAAVQEQVVALIEDPFGRASGLMRLAELRRLAGEPAAAWQALSECERVLQGVDDWQEVGLGRHFVQEHFELVVVTPDDEAARTVLAAGHRHAAVVPRLPFVALEAAVTAAERVGDTDLRDSYQTLRDTERRRIDTELDQLRQ